MAKTLQLDDIQGLIVRGYGALPAACYLLIKCKDHHLAVPWLQKLIGQITFADSVVHQQAINIALTYHGLSKLHLDESILQGFSDEFRSGMRTPHKQHILGDEGESGPEHWLWGGPATADIDLLLFCYAKNTTALNKLSSTLLSDMTDHGLELIAQLDTETLLDAKEHFGFRDSIGQPYIGEFDRHKQTRPNPVPLGEILLGYPNGYDDYTKRPLVAPQKDPDNLLETDPQGSTAHDLGFNGTYLVFRQLSQDVPGFWRNMDKQARQMSSKLSDPIALAAKLVGRWPSGTPLVQSPDLDDPDRTDKDNFNYHASDKDGLKCPLGAHIRRTNPRDSLPPEPGSEKSIAFSNRHRLLRRGRAYGKPFDKSMDPKKFILDLKRETAPASRGLHFICLNANIGRQFEFVQHTWGNNPNFNGLYRDTDPIIGVRFANNRHQDQFTIQQAPSRIQLQGLPTFVKTRGGGYFFVPSYRALSYLFSGSRPNGA